MLNLSYGSWGRKGMCRKRIIRRPFKIFQGMKKWQFKVKHTKWSFEGSIYIWNIVEIRLTMINRPETVFRKRHIELTCQRWVSGIILIFHIFSIQTTSVESSKITFLFGKYFLTYTKCISSEAVWSKIEVCWICFLIEIGKCA